MAVQLTAELIEAFSGAYLSPRYDHPRATPDFHRKAWGLYCSPNPNVMCIAPRDHAKTTALSVDYILAEALFKISDYIILIGSTELKAQEILSNIIEELQDNQMLRTDFQVAEFEVDSKTEIVVKLKDGHRFRILARGAEQRIRGSMWKGKRPNLLVCDDMEDDEQVENKDRRAKFRRWFFRAAKQALARHGRIRVHGTILHEDSLLNRLRKNKMWHHQFYKAHRSFDDFSDILWEDRWDEASLRDRRQEFIEDNDAAGYSQEFLNDPQDGGTAYLRRDDFLPMSPADFEVAKSIAVGWDFAVSKADLANRTSATVGGKGVDKLLHFLDFRVGRWNPSVSPSEKEAGQIGWIDLMFEVEERWSPDVHYVEGGVIWNSVENVIINEMQDRGSYLNLVVLNPIKDKATRGLTLKKRHRAGATRWNTGAEGYEDAKEEMLRFTGTSAARLDDQFDSAATLAIGLAAEPDTSEEDFLEGDDWERYHNDPYARTDHDEGRSPVTGY